MKKFSTVAIAAILACSLAVPSLVGCAGDSGSDAEAVAEIADETPLCRIGKPQEVASAMMFLASEDARFITGQVLGVNGGLIV